MLCIMPIHQLVLPLLTGEVVSPCKNSSAVTMQISMLNTFAVRTGITNSDKNSCICKSYTGKQFTEVDNKTTTEGVLREKWLKLVIILMLSVPCIVSIINSMSTNYVHSSFTVLLHVLYPTDSHHQGVWIASPNMSLSKILLSALGGCSSEVNIISLLQPPRADTMIC
jgi:hypothetical protein